MADDTTSDWWGVWVAGLDLWLTQSIGHVSGAIVFASEAAAVEAATSLGRGHTAKLFPSGGPARTDDTTTPERREAEYRRDREVIDAATPGEWWADDGVPPLVYDDADSPNVLVVAAGGGYPRDAADMRFIARARTRWPAALAVAESAEADRQRWDAAAESVGFTRHHFGCDAAVWMAAEITTLRDALRMRDAAAELPADGSSVLIETHGGFRMIAIYKGSDLARPWVVRGDTGPAQWPNSSCRGWWPLPSR